MRGGIFDDEGKKNRIKKKIDRFRTEQLRTRHLPKYFRAHLILTQPHHLVASSRGVFIYYVGDIGGIEMQEVPQTQFIPLPEALCLVISSLNRAAQPATLEAITESLREQYNGMNVPRKVT